MKVKRIPNYATYDYTDSFGQRHYHTKFRTYEVRRNGSVISERR